VEREQVVAALDAGGEHVLKEELCLDALAHQASLHVSESGDDRVDRALLYVLLELVEAEHPLDGSGTAGAGCIAIVACVCHIRTNGHRVLLQCAPVRSGYSLVTRGPVNEYRAR